MSQVTEAGRIARVDAIPLSIPFTHSQGQPAVTGTGAPWRMLDVTLVRIECVDGLVGWGECFAYTLGDLPRQLVEVALAPQLIGRNADELLERIDLLAKAVRNHGRGGLIQYALSGIDIALWDLRGRRRGESVRRMLGGTQRSVRAYASLFRQRDADMAADSVRSTTRQGFGVAKLHEKRPEVLDRARVTAGDEIALAADFSCAFPQRDEAVAGIEKLASFNLSWIEEPVWPPDDHHGPLNGLRERVTTRLSAGESEPNRAGLTDLAASRLVDIVQPSVTKHGGITAVWALIQDVAGTPVRVLPHSYYLGPGLVATLHLASLLGEDATIEWMHAEPEAWLLDEEHRPHAGRIAVPDRPGLGWEPDREIIKEYKCVT